MSQHKKLTDIDAELDTQTTHLITGNALLTDIEVNTGASAVDLAAIETNTAGILADTTNIDNSCANIDSTLDAIRIDNETNYSSAQSSVAIQCRGLMGNAIQSESKEAEYCPLQVNYGALCVETRNLGSSGQTIEANSGVLTGGVQRVCIATDDVNQAAINTATTAVAGCVASSRVNVNLDAATYSLLLNDNNKILARGGTASNTYTQRFQMMARASNTTSWTVFMHGFSDGHGLKDYLQLSSPADVTYQITSTSANDTNSGGTGARRIITTSVGVDGTESQNNIALTGQNPVTFGTDLLYPIIAETVTAGTGTTNEGTVYISPTTETITTGVPGTIDNCILIMGPGEGNASPGFIPYYTDTAYAYTEIYLTQLIFENAGSTNCEVRIQLWSSGSSGRKVFHAVVPPSTTQEFDLTHTRPITSGTYYGFGVEINGNTGTVRGQLAYYTTD